MHHYKLKNGHLVCSVYKSISLFVYHIDHMFDLEVCILFFSCSPHEQSE